MRGGPRRRVVVLHSGRPACHAATRRALRYCLRRAPRRAPRHVLKDKGPTLRGVCALVSTYLRLSKAYDKKWHPPCHFKTLGTPEERDRRMREDLDRAYGEHSPFVRAQAIRAAAPSASSQVSPPPAPVGAPLTPPAPQPRPACDVISVPLARLPNGILRCDWSKARPT
jgi:hypothetical protein